MSLPRARPPAYRMALASAIVAGLFSATVAVLLLLNFAALREANPLEPPRALEDAKIALKSAPEAGPGARGREALREHIRQLDLETRRDYYRREAFERWGAYLLLGGVIAFFLGLRLAMALRGDAPELPRGVGLEEQRRSASRSRLAVGVTALLLVAGAVTGVAVYRAGGPGSESAGETAFASADEMARNWPRFRGPRGDGRVDMPDLRLSWSVETGEGVRWKVPLELPGASSPIVWGDRVYLTSAGPERRVIQAFDARTGDVVWTHDCTDAHGSERDIAPKVHKEIGFAASTPATDGRRVYAIFANGDIVAVDPDGNRIWAQSLGRPRNQWGFAASLITWRSSVILLFDQRRRHPNISELIAFDGPSGDIRWSLRRDVRGSWTTPIVVPFGASSQLITAADPWVIAYDPASGRELWRAERLGGFATPSPVYDGERIFVVMQGYGLSALRPGGSGNVTESHTAWTNDEFALPEVSSPVADGELVFTVSTGGTITCFDARSGELIWQEELELRTWVSPSLVGDRILVFSQEGQARVVAAAREFRDLGRSELGEGGLFASPAFARVDGVPQLFVRTAEHLFCLGGAEGAGEGAAP